MKFCRLRKSSLYNQVLCLVFGSLIALISNTCKVYGIIIHDLKISMFNDDSALAYIYGIGALGYCLLPSGLLFSKYGSPKGVLLYGLLVTLLGYFSLVVSHIGCLSYMENLNSDLSKTYWAILLYGLSIALILQGGISLNLGALWTNLVCWPTCHSGLVTSVQLTLYSLGGFIMAEIYHDFFLLDGYIWPFYICYSSITLIFGSIGIYFIVLTEKNIRCQNKMTSDNEYRVTIDNISNIKMEKKEQIEQDTVSDIKGDNFTNTISESEISIDNSFSEINVSYINDINRTKSLEFNNEEDLNNKLDNMINNSNLKNGNMIPSLLKNINSEIYYDFTHNDDLCDTCSSTLYPTDNNKYDEKKGNNLLVMNSNKSDIIDEKLRVIESFNELNISDNLSSNSNISNLYITDCGDTLHGLKQKLHLLLKLETVSLIGMYLFTISTGQFFGAFLQTFTFYYVPGLSHNTAVRITQILTVVELIVRILVGFISDILEKHDMLKRSTQTIILILTMTFSLVLIKYLQPVWIVVVFGVGVSYAGLYSIAPAYIRAIYSETDFAFINSFCYSMVIPGNLILSFILANMPSKYTATLQIVGFLSILPAVLMIMFKIDEIRSNNIKRKSIIEKDYNIEVENKKNTR
ncbi:uncharacterized protein CMU_016040 [Cryptosporidium muris RN66]|uniref:Major facilitator superfamily protein n=1 Tax=Cryptosporidium muris (strain RN66) TaxID=441375 RepID=B6ACK1_CRYMR|nr:uncharacterized protein CMU_016040 [Cryptosporidium muris RN66]EEA05855.1 hypothetical protein CMU_016040 [Cryptosporidium muris RN66]|eukprot:XP_002140204.1 hypothetical protein [Cryptosporidium muris RN66]